MTDKKNLVFTLVKGLAETSLRNDANRTTCSLIYQPKAPVELYRFKKEKK